MGQYLGQTTKKTPTEEDFKNQMKRKWDNFGKTAEAKYQQENLENNNQIKEESINNQNQFNQNEILNTNQEEKPKEKTFLSLVPRKEEEINEEKKYEKDIEPFNNKNENEINNEQNNINNINEKEITDEGNNANEKEASDEKNNINDNENNNEIINNENENNNNKGIESNSDTNYNNETKKENENENKPIVKKNIDYEHTTIEKVFHITLDEDNPKKYLFLDFYLAKLLSMNPSPESSQTPQTSETPQTPSFKLENLDDIILTVINEQSIKNNLLNYLLDCFHRAYEIIEVRFKEVLGKNFEQIHLAIATYFGQIVSSPESFDLKITKKEISQIIKNYYSKTSEEEFLLLFKDITINCGDDIESLSQVLHYLFEIMHMENLDNQTFFKGAAIKKNLNILINILENYPKVREVFLNDVLYNPLNVNGRLKQAISFFGPYLSSSPLDAPIEQHRNAFKQFTNDSELKSYINKLNNINELLTDIVKILDDYNDEKSLNYIFSVINLNLDWQKTIKNFTVLSSLGFLLNTLFLSLNLFFNECHKIVGDEENSKSKEYKIKVLKYINTKFCLNDKNIIFSKFNNIYSPNIKEYVELYKSKSESIKYNVITKLFFICHLLMNYAIPALMKFYMEANKAASQAFSMMGFSNPKTREFIIKMKLFEVYVKNDKFIKYILEFNEITSFFLITLNNSKYSHNDDYEEEEKKIDNINSINEDEFELFKSDFFKYIDGNSNIIVSSLPECCILNIVNSCMFFRQTLPDIYYRDFDVIKNLTVFALIYSSRNDIIPNQYLRSQIFDILLYSFHMEEKERKNNSILYSHQKLLKDNFIKENLIFSIMRVFIDAERLGTANQFYERFNVRNKVLQFVNEVFKNNQEILIDNIRNYANIHSDEATKMLTLLMSDVSYLNDEVIQRLINIKKYQDLKDNKEEWNSKTDEEKRREDDKFNENDRMLKPECRLLNHSLGFLTIICSCLQEYFIKERKAEHLAIVLNYSLNEFTSKSSKLKIKNRKDYEFDPAYIMESLIKIYSYFSGYDEFIEYVVSDEINYNYDYFLMAIKLKNDFSKVKVDSYISEKFDDLVYNKLEKVKEIVDKKKINYDDAPEEFLDPLTLVLMEDPIILPTSHISIDRRTIEDYLLTNPTDPFNRNPLTKEELIPNPELKKRIDEYRNKKIEELQTLQKKNSKLSKEDGIKEEDINNIFEDNNVTNEEKEKKEEKEMNIKSQEEKEGKEGKNEEKEEKEEKEHVDKEEK